jgi:LPPG:FO 2-phospho-L-lactate transferase
MVRGLACLPEVELTTIVNVGDDDEIYGLPLSPDLDTVIYTLAGTHSEERGWGRTDETWRVMDELDRFGIDTRFRLGDLDLALNLYRSTRLRQGAALSEVTGEIARSFGIDTRVLPVTDGRLRTKLLVDSGWLDFQDYFVRRRHVDPVSAIRFEGAELTVPAPGVLAGLQEADAIVIGPSNPMLSIWPILAVPGVRKAMEGKRVLAVSPLVGGKAVKGPLAELMPALGYSQDTAGIAATYGDLISDLVVHIGDVPATPLDARIHETDTMIAEPGDAARLAAEVTAWLD